MRVLSAAILVVSAVVTAHGAPQSIKSKSVGAPESFNARATVGSAEGRGDAHVGIAVEKYSAEKDLQAMEKALHDGGSPAFVAALKKAPAVGKVTIGEKTFTVRWARQKDTDKGRTISFVVDSPVYFIGGGLPGAKSREGFDVAVILLQMDSSGVGEGKMAAAAKVKSGGATGVEIEAYDAEPVTLRSVMRKIGS
ncbi:MAG TPA: hypothetical protein VGI12_06155 [Vicinamibacterales bacterium]|jgi:hypothetical protein